MKAPRRIWIATWLAAALTAGPAAAQTAPGGTPAPRRGGYGGGSALTAPTPPAVTPPKPAANTPAAAATPAAPTTPSAPGPPRPTANAAAPAHKADWYLAVEARLHAVVAAIQARQQTAEQFWQQHVEGQIDRRAREILQQAGFSAGDLAQYYYTLPDMLPAHKAFTAFYADNAGILTQVDLYHLGNQPDYLGMLPYPDGNRKALEALADAAEEDLPLFAFYDEKLRQLLPTAVEFHAQYFAGEAMVRRQNAVIGGIDRGFDGGYYGDPANTAARRALRPASEQLDAYRHRAGNLESLNGGQLYAYEIFSYRLFGRFVWTASHAGHPLFRRTDTLVAMPEAARRLEAAREKIAAFYGSIFALYNAGGRSPDDRELVQLEPKYTYTIDGTIGAALRRPGIPEADLQAFEQEVQRLLDLRPAIDAFENQSAQLQRRTYDDHYVAEDAEGRVSDLKRHEQEVWSQSSEDQVKAMDAAIKQQQSVANQDDGIYGAVDSQLIAHAEAMKPRFAALGPFAPLAPNRINGAWIEFQAEQWPTKRGVEQEPLKGAPLGSAPHSQFPEVTFGVPGWVVVETTAADPSTSPPTLPLTLTIGGTTTTLTLRQAPNPAIYRSDPIVLRPTGAGGGGASPPATQDRGPQATDLAGSWNVAYEDLALGEIDGTALVDKTGAHASVTLDDPRSGKEYHLESTSITRDGAIYTIRLAGESPAAAGLEPDAATQKQAYEALGEDTQEAMTMPFKLRNGEAVTPSAPVPPHAPAPLLLTPPPPPAAPALKVPAWAAAPAAPAPPPQPISVPDSASAIAVQVAEYSGQTPFTFGPPVETGRVTLKLHLQQAAGGAGVFAQKSQVLLLGTWEFEADPATRRDGAGQGRVGYFRRQLASENVATQSASEIWWRGSPAQTQLLAQTVAGPVKVSRFFQGVPTVVEVTFDEPQWNTVKNLTIVVGGQTLKFTARRNPRDYRTFVSDLLLPTIDGKPAGP